MKVKLPVRLYDAGGTEVSTASRVSEFAFAVCHVSVTLVPEGKVAVSTSRPLVNSLTVGVLVRGSSTRLDQSDSVVTSVLGSSTRLDQSDSVVAVVHSTVMLRSIIPLVS